MPTPTPTPTPIPDLGRLVRQHARTLQLMGVPFVPFRVDLPHPEADQTEIPSPPLPSTFIEPKSAPVPSPSRPSPTPASAALPPRSGPIVPPPVVTMDERRQAAQDKLDAVRARYERDAPHTRFATDHHSIVFGEGDPCARLMFIGEAPGAEEDKVGRPFVGPAGQLLERMIIAMGLTRANVYIANVLKTRPPNNATPTLEEAALCAPYLFEQIRVVNPEVIVTLGLPASRVMLNSAEAMGKLRGQWHDWSDPDAMFAGVRKIPIMPTYHPAYLLRAYTAENRAKVWSDLKMVMDRLATPTH